MKKNILWLASYPKSGNTWLRLFLCNYLFNPDSPSPINEARRIGPSDASIALYRRVGGQAADLSDQRTALMLRRKVIAAHSANGADVNFMKTHNVNADAHGHLLIPTELTRGALYVIRNPLDVVVSYAHHYACDHDTAVKSLGSDHNVITPDTTIVQQYLGNWSNHVRSWERAKGFPTRVIRYEDMQAAPEDTFSAAIAFIGAPSDPARLAKAIQFSSFDEAKKQENNDGFIERPAHSKAFFRSGKVGEGREKLSPELIERVIADHGAVMRKYGYLD